jgi:hypothetical protein
MDFYGLSPRLGDIGDMSPGTVLGQSWDDLGGECAEREVPPGKDPW